jgi:VWFA-related protein
MVNVYAIVEDWRGRLVRTLSKQDFEVTENKDPQEIVYFSRETDAPLSLGLLIDTSSSQERLLSTEQKAAKMFLNSVLRKTDQAFFMRFDTDVELMEDFTNEQKVLASAVDRARINETGQSLLADEPASSKLGGTHLYDAVYLASNELMKTRYGRKVLVLVTDGEDQGSRSTLSNALAAAENADVIVYSIIVSDPEFYVAFGVSYHGGSKMHQLSRATGGRTINVKSTEEIGKAFDQVAAELRSQYVLGYLPPNLLHDGSFRTIHVRARRRGYSVKARAGYYAPAE